MKKIILGLLVFSSMAFAQTPMLTDTVSNVLRLSFSAGGHKYSHAIALGQLGGYTIECSGWRGNVATLYMHAGVTTNVLNIDLTAERALSSMKTDNSDQCQAMKAVLAAVSQSNQLTITVKSGTEFTLTK